HPDAVRALNSIDTVFDKRSDKRVREAWQAVLAHVNTSQGTATDKQQREEQARKWNEKLLDLRVDLYQALGTAVGYNHTIEYIKTHLYAPQYHAEVEEELSMIRKQFAKAITDEGLRVVI